MITTDIQQVQFVDDIFQPKEAKDVISKVFNEQINLLKLQNMSRWIGNENTSQDAIFKKIENLERKKMELLERVEEAKKLGLTLSINGTFSVEYKG